MASVEFGSLDAARNIRSQSRIRPFLADRDKGSSKTIVFKEDTPEAVLDDVTAEAAHSRRAEAEKVGQVALTDTERERIDFTRTNIPTARAVKAKAQEQNVDFLAVFDPELTVEENRALVEQEAGGRQASLRPDQMAREQATGDPFGGPSAMSQSEIDKSLGRAFATVDAEEFERAKNFAFEEADTDAREFVTEQGPRSEVFDISFSRAGGSLVGSGTDFERLQDRHERRSQRAQTIDERRTAPVTRDPFEWVDNPGRVDFPGIDTIEPQRIHEQRSERAQRMDEREIAPQAKTKEQWARNPGRYDWKTVDSPTSFGPTMDTEIPRAERNTMAPEPETAALSDRDVSLAPEEAFEGVGAVSTLETDARFQIPSGGEADMAFMAAEERRAGGGSGDILDTSDLGGQQGLGGEMVSEETQSSFAVEPDDTPDTRLEEESATEFGVDDRSSAARGVEREVAETEDTGLEQFGGGMRQNQSLDDLV